MTTTIDNNWWASGPGRSMCKKCGEEPPMVQEVADSRGVQNYCQTCSHSWWVTGALSCAEWKALLPYRSAGLGQPMRGSYDDHQLMQVRTCSGCGGRWHMHTDRCAECRAKDKDVSGVEITGP